MRYSCADCAYLNKSRKEPSKNSLGYRYGCDERKNGYICYWCKRDSDLNTGGCSSFVKDTVGQLSMFD